MPGAPGLAPQAPSDSHREPKILNDWLVPYLADLIKSPAVGGVAAVIAAAIAWFATKKDRRHREAELVAAARARIALDKRQGRTPPQHLVELVNRPRGADVDQEERYSAPAAAALTLPKDARRAC